jgi:hypothetical protein
MSTCTMRLRFHVDIGQGLIGRVHQFEPGTEHYFLNYYYSTTLSSFSSSFLRKSRLTFDSSISRRKKKRALKGFFRLGENSIFQAR